MEQKFQQDINRNITIRTPNLTCKTLWGRGNNHRVGPKIIQYENRNYNSQIYAKLESTINWIYNK